MNICKVTIFGVLIFLPLLANASEQLSHDQINAVLRQKTAEIKVIGMLKFCKKDGLADTLLTKVTSSIILDFTSAKETNAIAKVEQVIHAIDISTVGIANGLDLASLAQAQNKNFCSMAIDVADGMLTKKSSRAGS